MAPTPQYVLEGKIRVNSLIKCSAEVEHTVNTSKNGQTGLDLYIGGGTTTEVTEVFVKNLTTEEEISISTGSDGVFVYDLANLSKGYSNKDVILIRVSTYTTNDTDEFEEAKIVSQNTYNKTAKAIRNSLVDGYGNEFNNQNPLSVHVTAENLDFMNCRRVYTRNPANKNRITQVDFYYKGKHYRKTISYTSTTTDHSIIEEI